LKFIAPPASGVERVAVQYRFVRVADSPDTFRSMELGRIDRGDEVDVLERRSGYAHVRAPDGLEGWVPRMSLAPIEPAE
jgi:SH3-like domain-containing protein